MMEINLEIPDQNIDIEGESTSAAEASVQMCLLIILLTLFLTDSPLLFNAHSSAGRVWIPVPGRCFDQAQQSCQYSCHSLYAATGQ